MIGGKCVQLPKKRSSRHETTHHQLTEIDYMKPSIKPSGEDAAATSARLEIEKALAQYEAALNASDTTAVAEMFVADAAFMAPNNPSAIGLDAIQRAYDGIFQTITFDMELTLWRKLCRPLQSGPSYGRIRKGSSPSRPSNNAFQTPTTSCSFSKRTLAISGE